jgi:hypothetical protein
MRNITPLKTIIMCLCGIGISACSHEKSKNELPQKHAEFTAGSLIVKEDSTTKKVRGQVLYLPVYSNIPYMERERKYSLSAFVAIHNTDLTNRMTITKVLFFDNDGKPVANYLDKDSVIQPLGSTNFFIPENDRSGTGANFIVEWISDTLISEPLIESVMLGLSSGQGVSFSSIGRIIREAK